ncbi:MAG: glutamate 5-kinase [Acidimicrobiia bacterium]
MIVVAKIGSSSTTDATGRVDDARLTRLAGEIAALRSAGHRVILVVSGAISAGMPPLGITERPTDVRVLQALAAVGQPRLMEALGQCFAAHDCVIGQVLFTAFDFGARTQYLHARDTFERLFELGVVPIVNENDTVAEDEIRFGDNDRIAALVAHLVSADMLVLLTDTPGVFTADPRHDETASLIEEIHAVDAAVEAVVGGAGTARGSGGMVSKLAAAKIAAWSGVRAVIASSEEPEAIARAIAGEPIGTLVHPRAERLESRKLWIAFACPAHGQVTVDAGAAEALLSNGRSLLPVGVRAVDGVFAAGTAVEVLGPNGSVIAKGLSRYDADRLRSVAGMQSQNLPDGIAAEVIHRDDLVVLP